MSRTRPLRRALVATTAALAVPLVAAPLAGAASAAELTLTDARGDVWQLNEDANGSGDRPWLPAPRATTGDLTKATFAHTATRVVVKAKYAALEKPRGLLDFSIMAKTSSKEVYLVGVGATKRKTQGGMSLFALEQEDEIRCPDARHEIDYRKGRITLSLPRTCLGEPRWLRFAAMTFSADRREGLFDNPHNEKAMSRVLTSRVLAG